MNKRKAFTLIELLAVVVILGLLVAIAYPAVNKYINDTKETTYTLHEADMKSAASNMMSECIQNDTEDCVPEPGESKTIYLSELVDTKYSNPIKDPDKKDGYCSKSESYVIVTNTGDSVTNLEYDVCLTCDKYASGKCSELKPGGTCNSTSDTTKPVCGDVVGASTLWTNKDRVISVKCSDTGCGCTKETFYKTFTETGKTGSITITDKSGKSEECEVNVYIDKDMPTCELEVIGAEGENNWYGGSTAPVVKLKNMKDATSGIATYGMGLSSKNPEFNKVDSYTVKEGVSTVFGYVKDNAGNITICRTEDIYYDPVPATVTSVDYGNIVYPKADLASVDPNKRIITLDRTILDEYGDIYGLYFYQTSSSTGMSVTIKNGSTTVKTATLSSGVTTPIRVGFTSPIRVSSSNLTIDLGASNNINKISRIELVTRDDTVGYYTNQDVTLYINSHDSLSGKAYYTFDGVNYNKENYYTYTKNTNSVKFGIKDYAGNMNDIETIKITNIDKLNPSCTLKKSREKDGNGEDWFNKSVDVLFDTTRDATATTSYAMSEVRDWSLNNSTGRGDPKKRTQSVETGETIDTGYVIDNAGNINTCTTTVRLDLTDPTAGTITMRKNNSSGTEITTGAEVNTNVHIKLHDGSDTNSNITNSGHYTTKYTVKREGSVVDSNITADKTYSAEGDYEVIVTTTDQSGRTKTRNYTFMIDKTDPECGKVTGQSTTWINTSRTISIACSDPNGAAQSGCTAASYKDTWSTSTKTSTITIADQAGNSVACPVDVYVDVDKPTCGSDTGTTSWTAADRTVTVNCNDTGGSNCTQSSFSDTWTTSTKTDSITIRDVAGNTTTCGVDVYVDKTAPTCVSDNGSTTWINSSRTVTVNCGDDHSGCTSSTFSDTWASSTQTSSITIKDNVGHTTSCPVNVYVDVNSPTCGSNTGSTSWTNANRTVSVNCNDTGGSGCSSSSFSYTWKSTKKTSSITISDVAGNTASCGVNVYVDKAAPTCGTISGASTSWTGSSRYISVGCNDTGGSNCSSSSFGYTFSSTTTTGSITISDVAGNTTGCSVNVYVDKTSPSCGTVNKTTTNSTLGVYGNVGCSDSHSGCSSSTFSFSAKKSTSSVTISDSVGNTNSCSVTVSSKTQRRLKTCSTGNRCSDAGCETYKEGQSGAKCGYESSWGWPYVRCGTTCQAESNDLYIESGSYSDDHVACGLGGGCTLRKKNALTCRDSSFGCETYKSSFSKCGCETWGSTWGSWYDGTCPSNYSNGGCETRTLYY